MSRRPPAAWDRKGFEAYGYCSLGAVWLVLWTSLTAPTGIHSIADLTFGAGFILALSWVVAFLVAGPPIQRAHPKKSLVSQ